MSAVDVERGVGAGKIDGDIIGLKSEMQDWRRRLHAHPETAFEERATSDFVAGLLEQWGIEVHRGLAGTGVVGTLSVGDGNRSIGLRADMDGLDVLELNAFSHRSRIDGKMHACGHDGHMAMLLGAARHLSATRRFNGTVRFIFQPAEENVAGGRQMVEEGLFELFPVDAVFGMHNMPGIPEGKIVATVGPMMASADFFEIKIQGCGTHGAWPHRGIDVIGIASQMVLAFNSIVARTIDPLEAAVISITRIAAGDTGNVMPETATLGGTTRAFTVEVQDHIEQRMRQMCSAIAAASGAEMQFDYQRRYPPVINHAAETRFATSVAASVVGAENVLSNQPPAMGAEDFAWMLLSKPGAYVWIGNGDGGNQSAMLHSPRYDFNDNILPTGAAYWVRLAETWLTSH